MNGLPPIYEATLDDATLAALFADVRGLGLDVEVLPRQRRRELVNDSSLSLDEAVHLLHTGELDGVQLRYGHNGDRWFDTLTRSGEASWHLVRLNATAAANPATAPRG